MGTISNVMVGVATLEFGDEGGVGAFTLVGYTEDGVNLEYTADTSDIEVEEETFPIARPITKETLAVTCNMAESSLANMDAAIAGSVLAAPQITIGKIVGGGVQKEKAIRIVGTNPAGTPRTILIASATATGTVGMQYRKGEKTIVPVTFQALKMVGKDVCTIIDG